MNQTNQEIVIETMKTRIIRFDLERKEAELNYKKSVDTLKMLQGVAQ